MNQFFQYYAHYPVLLAIYTLLIFSAKLTIQSGSRVLLDFWSHSGFVFHSVPVPGPCTLKRGVAHDYCELDRLTSEA